MVAIDGPLGVRIHKNRQHWTAIQVPKGTHTFTYTARDCCGNLGTRNVTIIVQDKVAPVATAKEFVTVSLTRSGVDGTPGVAKLYPSNIDNGSYDHCGPVYMEIRREGGAPSCLNTGLVVRNTSGTILKKVGTNIDSVWNNNVTYNNDGHPQYSQFDTDNGAFVKFCCEDINKRVKVWLRVWDDADMNGVYGTAGDNYNETWAEVLVEDKTVPTLTCKDITITCDRALPQMSVGVYKKVDSKDSTSILPTISAICPTAYELEYRDVANITTCNTGTITRTYRIVGTGVTCTSLIIIDGNDTIPTLEVPIELHTWNKCTLTEADVMENTVRAALIDGEEIVRDDYDLFDRRRRIIKDERIVECEVATGWSIHPMTTNGVTPSGANAS